MSAKFPYVILGAALMAWGASIIIDPIYYSSRFTYTWDFTEIKWYFGGLLVILGGYFVVSSLLKKK
jgi:hypothetical protein